MHLLMDCRMGISKLRAENTMCIYMLRPMPRILLASKYEQFLPIAPEA